MIKRHQILAPFVSPMVVAISAAFLALAACASAPPARPVTELKNIAGHWVGVGGVTGLGSGTTGSWSGPTELTIRENGTAEFFLPLVNREIGGRRYPVTLRVESTKVVYETGTHTGTITLREGEGKRILQGESVRKDKSGTGWFELTPAK